MTTKVADHHLNREACIYLRQSTPGQVRFNRESTERQYQLSSRARELGWPPERIRILDRDLGQSSSTARDDFKTLVNDVAMGQVGAVFALEASRLARSSQQWHRLLELCAITRTIVIDEDGEYDPADFNDSLVLGLKGTFAQAELHIIRARLHGGKLNKAAKGDLHFPLPVGLVFEDDKIVLDPDQEIQGAVRAVFELFEQEGSAYRVVRRFHDLGLRFPRRAYGGAWDGRIIWGRLTHGRVLGILANPCYAGTYVFGRHQAHRAVGADGEIYTRSVPMPPEAWSVTLHNHHPGYITWDQFVANRQRLAANRTNGEAGLPGGPAREGLCLLQGLLVCGHCGRRLTVRYTGNGGLYPMYQCLWRHREALAPRACLSFPATVLDDRITARLAVAVTPTAIDLALDALTTLEARDQAVAAQWQRRVERARYEVDLAERRYETVDPANRLVAATLEQRWEAAIQRLRTVEAELATFEHQQLKAMTAEQKRRILALATDFPTLWAAPTTSARDRKRLLRLLIRDITVTRGPEPKRLCLNLRWQGGATETLELALPPRRADVVRYPQPFITRLRGLAETLDDRAIADRLDAEGLRSSTGKRFTVSMIRWLRYRHRIPAPAAPEGTLSVRQVRERYGVSLWVVHYWIQHGHVEARQCRPGMPYAITITDEIDAKLRTWIATSCHLPAQSPTLVE